ncbi:MAG: alpha/beta hydrolase [Pseudomonadota bacterium]
MAERRYAKVSDLELSYLEVEGEGTPVLYLHGWPDDATIWRHELERQALSGRSALALDWPSHGKSTQTRDLDRFAITELSDMLAAFLQIVGLDRVHLVAHDYGAVVAWDFAACHSTHLESYTAVCIGHPAAILRNPSVPGLLKNWFLLFNALPGSVQLYRAANSRFFRWAMKQHPDRLKVVERLNASPDGFYIRVWERGNPMTDLVRDYMLRRKTDIEKVDVPTFGLFSERDQYAHRPHMERSADYVNADWMFGLQRETGHWPMLQEPRDFGAHIKRWLDRVEGRLA